MPVPVCPSAVPAGAPSLACFDKQAVQALTQFLEANTAPPVAPAPAPAPAPKTLAAPGFNNEGAALEKKKRKETDDVDERKRSRPSDADEE